MAALAAMALSGCGDAHLDPMAVIQTEETRSVLALTADLPALPELAERPGVEGDMGDAVTRWTASWHRPLDAGRAMRDRAYGDASVVAADAVGEAGIRGMVGQVDAALAVAEPLLAGDPDPEIAAGILRARLLRDEAVRSLAAGRLAVAMRDVLGASDALRELGPQAVARALLARAEEALAREAHAEAGTEGGVSDLDLERGEHLVLSARLALDDQDWTRAVRRAYYACQLLGATVR
jgi:hypothetical protein